jgi:hypothetical protein
MEQLLPGGFVNAVIRVGDTVRRPRSGHGLRPATRPCGGFVTGALSEPCGPTMPG